ncbi:Golgi to ER traffic protein 4 homolog [Neltuma alba]|uniref:Golgi to ER traffic protein 4 homolog n=2 Tax=Neltuma alba TaxID=207710 RepID=UPI0010A33472|nr:Golgi to ER traffic protein 4 homolog [Prosopis alba]XP_028782628.1 Golgi to ER traffic protein 4 homolog [Prosopis alba]
MSRERLKRGALPPAQENIDKLQKVVNEGNYYGAQQMYKSVSVRYVSAQRYSEALDLLQSGACIQLAHGQVTCGAELALLFVETLVKAKVPYDNETLERLEKIYKAFPRVPLPQNLRVDDDMQQISEALGAAKTRVEGCSSFLKAAIRWSAEFGANNYGSPELHIMLAEYIYYESPEVDMARVTNHFVRGNNPKKFASILVDFMGKRYPGEDDLAIARAVLRYLSSGNLRDANILMEEIKNEVASKEIKFPQTDLMQFVNFLLQTLERDALPLFNMLRANYKSSIDREPAFNEMLDDIAEKFYGVQRRNPMGMFGDIFKLMGAD